MRFKFKLGVAGLLPLGPETTTVLLNIPVRSGGITADTVVGTADNTEVGVGAINLATASLST